MKIEQRNPQRRWVWQWEKITFPFFGVQISKLHLDDQAPQTPPCAGGKWWNKKTRPWKPTNEGWIGHLLKKSVSKWKPFDKNDGFGGILSNCKEFLDILSIDYCWYGSFSKGNVFMRQPFFFWGCRICWKQKCSLKIQMSESLSGMMFCWIPVEEAKKTKGMMMKMKKM